MTEGIAKYSLISPYESLAVATRFLKVGEKHYFVDNYLLLLTTVHERVFKIS